MKWFFKESEIYHSLPIHRSPQYIYMSLCVVCVPNSERRCESDCCYHFFFLGKDETMRKKQNEKSVQAAVHYFFPNKRNKREGQFILKVISEHTIKPLPFSNFIAILLSLSLFRARRSLNT